MTLKQYTDQQLENRKRLYDSIFSEHLKQIRKWGVQTHSLFEWQNYVTEEVGELAKAISEHQYRKGEWKNIYDEAIQVATLSLKIAEMILVENKK